MPDVVTSLYLGFDLRMVLVDLCCIISLCQIVSEPLDVCRGYSKISADVTH